MVLSATPVPVMVITVEPAFGPKAGIIDVIVGGGGLSNCLQTVPVQPSKCRPLQRMVPALSAVQSLTLPTLMPPFTSKATTGEAVPMPTLPLTKTVFALIVPDTSSFVAGNAVPIPTLPFSEIDIPRLGEAT